MAYADRPSQMELTRLDGSTLIADVGLSRLPEQQPNAAFVAQLASAGDATRHVEMLEPPYGGYARLVEALRQYRAMDDDAEGIVVSSRQPRLLAEEAPYAYKDVSEVVSVCERAGLSKRVARLRPLAVVKG